MMRSLLVRGMLVGIAAAGLALVFAWILGEPQISRAIAFEDHHDRLTGVTPDPEIFSRSVQKTLGLATVLGLAGIALGGMFALAFAVAYGRIGNFSARATAALVAGGGFVSVELVPFLKYPANPPAIGNDDTIGKRTILYVVMIAIGLIATIAATQIGRRLAARHGNWNATLTAGAVFLALITIAYITLPAVNEVPATFPAVVLWRFRLASLGIQVILWTALGLGFGALTERTLIRPRPTPRQVRSP